MWPPRIIAKLVGAVEVRRSRQRRDRQLRRVDQIRVELVLARARADAEQAVLGVQDDPRVGGEEARDQVRDPDPEVDDLAGTELAGGPLRDPGLDVAAHGLATR